MRLAFSPPIFADGDKILPSTNIAYTQPLNNCTTTKTILKILKPPRKEVVFSVDLAGIEPASLHVKSIVLPLTLQAQAHDSIIQQKRTLSQGFSLVDMQIDTCSVY